MDLCNIVWGNSSEANKLKIFRLQKRACQVILDYNIEDFHDAMSILKILSVYDRLWLGRAEFMFKVFNRSTPEYISENFTLRYNVNTTINLGSTSTCCFVPPKPLTECFRHGLGCSGCLVWNGLPEEVGNASAIFTFHNRCIKWLTH